ncbi:retrovirus-related Pol polyprotein from transposon 297 [Trichonephila clavipes]|nr:retrovirus-related Pol polyprotein from transposon 297 [Trichonephila clavipes]
MGLYLKIFERQVKFLNIPEKTWTAYLIGSLPPDIAQLIAREDEEDAQNYEKKNQPVGGSHEYHSSGPSRTVPRSPSFKNKGRNPIQCYGCGTPGVVKPKCPTCTRANEMETAVSCMPLFNLNSNLYPTSVIVLKIFGEKIAVCADTGASYSIADEKMFKFLQEHDITFTNKNISFMMADGIRQAIMALSTVVDLYIEGKVIPTEFLVLPDAKGNKTLLGLDFLNAAGIILDVQGGKWHFSGNPQKQYKFFKKTLEDITLSAFELRKDEGKNLSPEQARKINILLDRNEACFQPGESIRLSLNTVLTPEHPAPYPYRMNPVKKQDYQKENFDRRRRKYYKPGDKVWVTIHPINRNNRSRKGPYLILTLRSPVTYEIADPANPDRALRTYHVSALKDYQEPETERNTRFVAPLKKRGRPKRNYLLVSS